MLKTGQIYKVDRKEKFVDIRQAFGLGEGKVVLQFRSYDTAKAQGTRCFNPIDFYLDIEEFDFLTHMLATGMFQQKAAREAGEKTCRLFQRMGGCSEKDEKGNYTGKVLSRILTIEGNKDKLFLKVIQGPGKKDAIGKITAAYSSQKDPGVISYAIPLEVEEQRIMGYAGQRAVHYFDEWSISGVLEQKISGMTWKKDSSDQRDADFLAHAAGH